MRVVRERIPEKGTQPVRVVGYVRTSAERHLDSENNQKAAIRRQVETQTVHISSIHSEKHRLQSR